MEDTPNLQLRKRLALAALTRLETFTQAFNDNVSTATVNSLKRFANEADSLRTEFLAVVMALGETKSKIDVVKEIDEFEKRYLQLTLSLESMLQQINPPISPSTTITSPTPNGSSVTSKLPRIEIPKFSGHYTEWLPFQNTFESLIHSNNELSAVEKFHHLRSALSGDAAEAIKCFSLTSDNYLPAWRLLRESFENKRLIVQHHVHNLFNLPSITKDSASSLRQLLNTVSTNLEALKMLQINTSDWDCLIIHLITTKLDFISKRCWEESLITNQLPTLEQMNALLKQRAQTLESLEVGRAPKFANPSFKKQQLCHTSNVTSCPLCKNSHLLYHCKQFLQLNVNEKMAEVRRMKLCENCLKGLHHKRNCRSSNCRVCGSNHHSLLHVQRSQNTITNHPQEPSTSTSNSVNAFCRKTNQSQILLSTAMVNVKDANGGWRRCRALLDSGSQSNFLLEGTAKKLGIPCKAVNIPVAGINQATCNITKMTTIKIHSCHSNFNIIASCLILPKITENLPIATFEKKLINIPPNIQLADPDFNQNQPIEILLGAEFFWQLACNGRLNFGSNGPYFQETNLGWIISGKIPVKAKTSLSTNHLSLNKCVEKFWEIDNFTRVSDVPILTSDEANCEQHFKETYTRDKNGRFIVRLPFKKDPADLGNSLNTAKNRFLNLEKRLLKNDDLKTDYRNFIKEYISLDHMEPVRTTEENHYLPHHAVLKQSSLTTKLRVVFDGSAKTSRGVSLNDYLMVGPTIQSDLFSIIIRFRTHKYAFTADITKMYRQIWVDPKDRHLQCILWRDEPDEPITSYRLKTITYGTASASFSAVRCLHQIAEDTRQRFPLAYPVIIHDFYMDDVLTGAASIEEACNIRDQLINSLEEGCFPLNKWAANHPRLLPTEDSGNLIVDLGKTSEAKTLGLLWDTKSDIFKYAFDLSQPIKNISKRQILSAVSKVFDPLGLVGPSVLDAKLIIQNLWTLKLGWDQPVPEHIKTRWQKLFNQLSILNALKIPRNINCGPSQTIELHGFADASTHAYGAAIYVRSKDSNDKYSVHLLCAKSRVAPLKTTTLPRLELCAATLLIELMDKVLSVINLNIAKKYYWTDSSIVLAWIASTPNRFKVFVAHRIAEIQNKSTVAEWYHVKSADNPADLISRGMLPQQLKESNLWWEGPTWLKQTQAYWPKSTIERPKDLSEQKTCQLVAAASHIDHNILDRFSSFTRLIRTIAYCLRFIKNMKSANLSNGERGRLTSTELKESESVIMKLVQRQFFPNEYAKLSRGEPVDTKSKLISLNPFIDREGCIRVGGRLSNAESMPFDKKHPIILPADHHLTKLLIEFEHERHLHAGAQATLAAIRERFWIIRAKGQIRKILHRCVKCFKANPKVTTQIMGNLPNYRIEPSRPFTNCGVDYSGPFRVREGRSRGRFKTNKAYMAVFICLATKAVHIELISDCTTEAFLKTLKRFIARRGMIANMYSDNGTTFVGANNELKKLKTLFEQQNFGTDVITPLTSLGITWHFIPPRAPHMGGIWESAIKSAKYHIKRIVGNALLTFEDMTTVLSSIEACLNSRPLTPLSDDPNDPNALTPGHFLIGCALTTFQEPDITHLSTGRLSHYQRIVQLRQNFWKRWSKEYIGELQQRTKWQLQRQELCKVGRLVLIKDDNLPPLAWKLGRITELHRGKDNLTRVVSVIGSGGATVQRPLTKICVLPMDLQ